MSIDFRDEISYEGQVAKLRAGSPLVIKKYVRDGSGRIVKVDPNDPVRFVLHTFMVEVNKVDFITCTSELPKSSDFRGQGGKLVSANFTRLNAVGGNVFSGKRVYEPFFVEEDYIRNIGTDVNQLGEGEICFIDCTSLSLNYDIMGLVTISYTIIQNVKRFLVYKKLNFGGKEFVGWVTNVSLSPIKDSGGWFETNVSLVAEAFDDVDSPIYGH